MHNKEKEVINWATFAKHVYDNPPIKLIIAIIISCFIFGISFRSSFRSSNFILFGVNLAEFSFALVILSMFAMVVIGLYFYIQIMIDTLNFNKFHDYEKYYNKINKKEEDFWQNVLNNNKNPFYVLQAVALLYEYESDYYITSSPTYNLEKDSVKLSIPEKCPYLEKIEYDNDGLLDETCGNHGSFILKYEIDKDFWNFLKRNRRLDKLDKILKKLKLK